MQKGSLEASRSATIAGGFFLLAGGLSRVEIIDLIAKGYTAMAYGFLLLMAIPLMTVGPVRILRRSPQR